MPPAGFSIIIAAAVFGLAVATAGCAEPPRARDPLPETVLPVVSEENHETVRESVGVDEPFLKVGPYSAEVVLPPAVDRARVEGTYGTTGDPRALPLLIEGQVVMLPFLSANRTYWYEIDLGGRPGSSFAGTFTTLGHAAFAMEEPIIFPGAQIITSRGTCTAGFVLRDATNSSLFLATAGHCVQSVGETTYVVGWDDPIGTVAAFEDISETDEFQDWALIALDPSLRGRTSPSMPHFSGPTGLAQSQDVPVGAHACFVGKGDVILSVEPTSPHRCGVVRGYGRAHLSSLVYLTAESWSGDSGAAIVDYDTGLALGILISGLYGIHTTATSVCSILDRAGQAGLTLAVDHSYYAPGDAVAPLVPDAVPWPIAYEGSLNCTWPFRVL